MRVCERPAPAEATGPRSPPPPPGPPPPPPSPPPSSPSRCRRRNALALADVLLSAGVVAPAVVGYWRGTWCLMDWFAGESSWAPSLAAGLAGHLLFTLGQHRLAAAGALLGGTAGPWSGACCAGAAVASPAVPAAPAAPTFAAARDAARAARYRRVAGIVASRLYTAVFGFCCVNTWRGIWKLLDQYSGIDPRLLLATGAFGATALVASRTLRNISSPPFALVTDGADGYFDVPTMFRVPSTRHAYLYVLDCLFSVLVVGTLVVFVWRGVWTLLDVYLYPEQPPESAWASLALGYVIVVVTFALQPLLKRLCARLRGFCRLLVADIYLFFSFLGTVNLWRGFWNILNEYFLVEYPLLSFWVTHVVCLLLLMLLNCSNSILVRGVYIDAEEEGGKCVDFPTHYLRLFVKERRGSAAQQGAEEQLERILAANGASGATIVPAATGNGAGAADGLLAPPGAPAPHAHLLPSNHLPLATLLAPSPPKSAL